MTARFTVLTELVLLINLWDRRRSSRFDQGFRMIFMRSTQTFDQVMIAELVNKNKFGDRCAMH